MQKNNNGSNRLARINEELKREVSNIIMLSALYISSFILSIVKINSLLLL